MYGTMKVVFVTTYVVFYYTYTCTEKHFIIITATMQVLVLAYRYIKTVIQYVCVHPTLRYRFN
jgi:hypothetical protein